MRIIMTSSIGGSIKENGKKIPAPLLGDNNFLEKIQNEWIHNSKVMIIAASPDDYERNDMICECFTLKSRYIIHRFAQNQGLLRT